VPAEQFRLATRRGKRFNSILLSDKGPLTGSRRHGIIMSTQDDATTLSNRLGEFHSHVRIDRIKPGCLEAHWPEVPEMNVLISAEGFDPSGIPGYNAALEVVRGAL